MGPSPATVYGALILVQILFGINYAVSKLIVQTFPPLAWNTVRLFISFIFLMLIAKLWKRPFPANRKEFFSKLFVFSLFGVIINQSAFLTGLKYTTAVNSSIINTLTPILTVLLVTLMGKERFRLSRAFGILLAFSGVLAIRKIEEFTLSNETAVGDLLTFLNCLSFSIFLATSQEFIRKYDRIWTTAFMFAYGFFGIGALSIPDWSQVAIPELTPLMLGAMAYSIFGATVATYSINNWALVHANPSSIALLIYIQPPVAAALGWAWLGEVPTLRTLTASLLIFFGLIVSNYGEMVASRFTTKKP